MFGKKILFLAAGYIAGNMVSSVYKTTQGKAGKQAKKQDLKNMFEDFLHTQKNLFSDIEKKYLSEKGQKTLKKTKKEFLKQAKKYSQQGQEILEELQKNEKVIEGKKKATGAFSKVLKKGKDILEEVKKEEK